MTNQQYTLEHEPKPLSPAERRLRVVRSGDYNIDQAIAASMPQESLQATPQIVPEQVSTDELAIRRARNEAESLAITMSEGRDNVSKSA